MIDTPRPQAGDARELTADDGFREQLAALLEVEPTPAQRASDHVQAQAAVLVPIFLVQREPHLVLTERHGGLARHAGEISFPGGRRDPGDATLLDTALRECEEEIGLPREAVQPLGALRPTSTRVTNYLIHPFVGWIAPSARWRASPAEVSAVLELPLRALAAGLTQIDLTRQGFTFATDAYLLSGHVIWGATARIIDDLLGRIGPLLASHRPG